MKKNMLIRILSLICVLACLFAFASCHDDLATKEEVNQNKTDAETALTQAKDELNKLIAEVRQTADAAAVKTDLAAAIARLEAVEGTANAAATLEALNAVKADLDAVKVIAEASATKDELNAAIAKIEALESAAAKQVDLEAVKTALEGDVADINEALDAIDTEFDDVKALIEQVKATADAAVTEKMLNDAIAALELDKKIADAKTELKDEIIALETRLQGKVDEINDRLDKLNVPELSAKVDELLERLDQIDVEAFKKDYGELTEKLFDTEYEYAYVKFVEIVLDIGEGPYDPADAKEARLEAENILFAVTRCINEAELANLYNRLVEIKSELKTLEQSLTEWVNNITVVDTTKEFKDSIADADKLYAKMQELEIEFADQELKAEYERIWNAHVELNGGVDKNGMPHNGFAVDGSAINAMLNEMIGRDVTLGTIKNITDLERITDYQKAIKDLKDAIQTSAYHDLYKDAIADELIQEATAEVKARIKAAKVAELVLSNKEAYKAVYEEAKIEELIGYVTAEDTTMTPTAGGIWEELIIASIVADLKAANAELSDEDALTQATEAYAADPASYYAKVSYDDAKVVATDKVTNDADIQKALYEQADAQIDTEADEFATADVANYGSEVFAIAMANSLFNKVASEAIAERYYNMVAAKDYANANIVLNVVTVLNNWKNSGLLYNDTTAQDALDAIAAWVANVEYKTTNEAYLAVYPYGDDNVSDDNRNIVLGKYDGTDVEKYDQLVTVDGYVDALLEIYDSFNFVGVDGEGEEAEELYNVNGVEAFIVELKKAINGVDVDGKITLDVDNILIDLVDASIIALDKEIAKAANGNTAAIDINKEAMVPVIARTRLAFVESVETAVAEIVAAIKADNFAVITAATLIKDYEDKLDVLYSSVLTKAEIINTEYSSQKVTSSLAEAALDWAYNVFEEFTKYAGEQYLKAKALVEKLEKLGAVKLNHGKDIYDVATALQSIAVVIPGLTPDTEFPVKNEQTGEHEMVSFSLLQDKIVNKYVPEYKALADEAVAKAAELKTAIDSLVASVGNNANKLDNFNAIVNMMTKVNTEWLVYFYSEDMHGKTDADKYAYATNVISAIKAAVANTTDTKIIGGLGATYVFLANDTFESLETITNTAISTYKTVEKKAAEWIKDAEAIVNGGDYTFHDWNKDGKNFKNIEEAYAKIVADYYIITALAADTDPDFGLYEAHEAFIVEYNKCKDAYEKSAAEIKKIEDAIKALGAYSNITLTNTDANRTTVNEIFTMISNFEDNYCGEAQKDGDINADLLFALAKYDAVVQVLEAWVAVEANWDPAWDVDSAYATLIESADLSIQAAIDSGNFATTADAIANFVTYNSNQVVTIQ